jgi:hypothetical protein
LAQPGFYKLPNLLLLIWRGEIRLVDDDKNFLDSVLRHLKETNFVIGKRAFKASDKNQSVNFRDITLGGEFVGGDRRAQARRIHKTEPTSQQFSGQLHFGHLYAHSITGISFFGDVLPQFS